MLRDSKRKNTDDEYYTSYRDVVKELHKYDLRGYKIICPCDSDESNIYRYLKDCDYDVTFEYKEWRSVCYDNYDLIITNPPFSQIKEFVASIVKLNKKFIIIVSDVFRYMIEKGKYVIPNMNCELYQGKAVYMFYRPDGVIAPIHCIWISNFQDSFKENKLIPKLCCKYSNLFETEEI